MRLAQALGRIWAQGNPGSTIVVGFDTRRHSERLAVLAGQVLAGCGLRVLVSDRICPIPCLGWTASRDPHCIGAVMLTASEAPYEYGGIIVRQSDGSQVSTSFAEVVEQRVAARVGDARGEIERADFVSPYLDDLVAIMQPVYRFGRRPKVVVDCLYGAGVNIASTLFERLGCEVIRLHDAVVPDFRGIHPDAREPWVDACEQLVLAEAADLGVVIDGDGDRMGLVDERGRLVSQHAVAPLALQQLARINTECRRVVGTFSSSLRVRRQAEQLGLEYTMVPVGFDALYREFVEGDVLMTADEEGCICAPWHMPERDGLLASAAASATLLAGPGRASEVLAANAAAVGPAEWGSRRVKLDPPTLLRLRNLLPGTNPEEVIGLTPLAVSHAGGLRLEVEEGWVCVRLESKPPAALVEAEGRNAAMLSKLLSAGTELARTLSIS